MSSFILYAIITLALASGIEANKYLKDKTRLESDKNKFMYNADIGRHFRMTKILELWTKAEKRLTGQALAECYAELKVQDKLEYDLKWLKSKNKHKAMEKEANVNLQLMAIARKYDLGDYSDMNKHNIPDPHRGKTATELKSKNLKKLWKQAHYSGFTDDELGKLQDEFLKHQEKQDRYEKMRDELAEMEKMTHNNLGSDEELRIAHKQFKAKNKETKEMHRKLNKKLDGLSQQVNEAKLHEEFTDIRVYQLYAMAKKTAMSEQELENFEEELQAFQQRITKHETLKEMLTESKDHFDKFVDKEKYPQKHKDLEDKTKHYNHMVNKYHNELYQRVDTLIFKHTEL